MLLLSICICTHLHTYTYLYAKQPTPRPHLYRECPGKYACVFGSDIIYAPSDIRPLLKCAAALLAPGPRSRLVLAMTAHRFSQVGLRRALFDSLSAVVVLTVV